MEALSVLPLLCLSIGGSEAACEAGSEAIPYMSMARAKVCNISDLWASANHSPFLKSYLEMFSVQSPMLLIHAISKNRTLSTSVLC